MAKWRGLVDVRVWNGSGWGYWGASGTRGNAGVLLGRLERRGCKSGMGSTCTSWNPVGALQRDWSGSLHRATGSRREPVNVSLGRPGKALRWERRAGRQAWRRDGHRASAGDAGLEECDGAWALDCRCGQLDGGRGFTFRNKRAESSYRD